MLEAPRDCGWSVVLGDLGQFRGGAVRVHAPLEARLLERLQTKRWQYFFLTFDQFAVSGAIFDGGVAGLGFASLFDLVTKTTLERTSWLGVSQGIHLGVNEFPREGLEAWFNRGQGRIECSRPRLSDSYQIQICAENWRLTAELSSLGAPAGMSVVTEPLPGKSGYTEKQALLPARGTLWCRGSTYRFERGLGGTDYSSGIFPRRVEWDWFFGMGESSHGPIAWNLCKGNHLGGQSENTLWINGEPEPVGAVKFEMLSDTQVRIQSDDGQLDLTVSTLGAHEESRNLWVTRTHLLSRVGLSEGRYQRSSGQITWSGLVSVIEHQNVKW